MNQTVASIVVNATSQDAFTIAQTLSNFLKSGNETFDFKLFHSSIDLPPGQDIANYVLQNQIGRCTDYNAAFVTMARLAGIPARYVTGYSGGQWNGGGYTVTTQDYTSWGEVKLSLDTGVSVIDLGWIPFDSCPQSENLTIAGQAISPLSFDRDLSANLTLAGQFMFSDNQTVIENFDLEAYFVPIDEVPDLPGSGLTEERLISRLQTNSSGEFSFDEAITSELNPGIYSIVILHRPFELISNDIIVYDSDINLTEDSVITHEVPLAINNPVVGAGSITTIQGQISYENSPIDYFIEDANSSIYLAFDSSVNGTNNLTGSITNTGAWSITVELEENEVLGLKNAELWFEGWVQELDGSLSVPEYHLRPSKLNITLDIREAPNLTATIEGPLLNKSIFVVNQDIWVNGTAKSLGISPVDMEGELVLSIRENGSFEAWSDIFNITVNGTFSIQQQLTAQLANFGAGELEVRLRFLPNSISNF